ncbi:MAG: hypothetical protein HY689_01810 [Chloroflexi bacterium]|nr:hypothetical protein [Chloroflexota bacterium]
MPLVDYLIARDGLPPRSGDAYDYVLAGDGLYLVTENDALEVRMPVALAQVRGLPPLGPRFFLRGGRIPQAVWEDITAAARLFSARGQELLLAVTHHEGSGYRLVAPRQIAGSMNVLYERFPDVVLAVHSHHRYPAVFSPTDDADEQGFGLYGVLGRLDEDRPEVSLRVGVYGYFFPLPWGAVFDGRRGAFRDANLER